MKKSTWLLGLIAAAAAQCALADETPSAPPAKTIPSPRAAEVRAACEGDAQKLCPAVQPGGGRIIACLKQHKEEVSDGCKQAIAKAKQPAS